MNLRNSLALGTIVALSFSFTSFAAIAPATSDNTVAVDTMNYPLVFSEEYIGGKGEWFQLDISTVVEDEEHNLTEKLSKVWKYMENGSIATGWRFIDNNWYYFDEAGVMKSAAWFQDNLGNWHYFNENGSLATEQWIDNKYVDIDGILTSGNFDEGGVYVENTSTTTDTDEDLSKYTLDYSALSETAMIDFITGNNKSTNSGNSSNQVNRYVNIESDREYTESDDYEYDRNSYDYDREYSDDNEDYEEDSDYDSDYEEDETRNVKRALDNVTHP